MATEGKPAMTTIEVLTQFGSSQCIEYRRAWRRAYRANRRRVDYMPDMRATKAMDQALLRGWALSQPDAINQALVAWAGWMAQHDPE